MKKIFVMAAIGLTGSMAGHAQEAETFSIATLNVDGLPQKILVAKVNPDGPGGGGSVRIGRYLQKRGYDMVFMQEDFNYHEELTVPLEDDYQTDTWSGDVGVEGRQIDFLHLQNHRFECDGLMGVWKKGITLTSTVHTPWTANFGKFSHALDEMVTKGFRRYELTLTGGQQMGPWNSPGKNTKVIAISFFSGSYQPRDRTPISYVSFIVRRVL